MIKKNLLNIMVIIILKKNLLLKIYLKRKLLREDINIKDFFYKKLNMMNIQEKIKKKF